MKAHMGQKKRGTRTLLVWWLTAAALIVACSITQSVIGRRGWKEIPPVSPHDLNETRVPVEFRPAPGDGVVYSGALLASDGRVYLGLCPGKKPAKLLAYDVVSGEWHTAAVMTSGALRGGPDGGKLPEGTSPVLLDEETEGLRPGNTWKHVQNKIHARLYEGPDGRIYGATHASVGNERPNNTRTYGGGHFFAYDPKTGETIDLGWARRHEGIMSVCMDMDRMIIYGITWPCGILVSCHADRPEDYRRGRGVRTRILGLTASDLESVPRYMEVLDDGRMFVGDGGSGDVLLWVPDDYEEKIRPRHSVKPGRVNRLTGMRTPHYRDRHRPRRLRESSTYRNWWQTGARSPDGKRFFVATQRRGQLFEIDGAETTCGRIIDHPWAKPWDAPDSGWASGRIFVIAFGKDGHLYYLADSHLLSYDPESGRVLDWGVLVRGDDPETDISHCRGPGSVAEDGTIYFAATVMEMRPKNDEDGMKEVGVPGVAWFNPARMAAPKLLYTEP